MDLQSHVRHIRQLEGNLESLRDELMRVKGLEMDSAREQGLREQAEEEKRQIQRELEEARRETAQVKLKLGKTIN